MDQGAGPHQTGRCQEEEKGHLQQSVFMEEEVGDAEKEKVGDAEEEEGGDTKEENEDSGRETIDNGGNWGRTAGNIKLDLASRRLRGRPSEGAGHVPGGAIRHWTFHKSRLNIRII
ncbi:hypothetical protein NDU88_004830 [Pleurodeles waltl]|uniref:Uncharacterized protein n=1 Tax=Pleurodeles waltl TaxID=8319 RepID=A0AAV7RHC2_PLEWA|nr:hypothetical protein NDU88_004830 [Pleurodeles waltl]